jgi:DNA-binding SARP family transcriptional activator
VTADGVMQNPVLAIRLFGALDLRCGDRLLSPLASARAETLLAYLLLHRDAPQSRQHLAFVLWPDSQEAQARTNLRHVLHDLRRALPDADRFLNVSARTLQWRTDTPFWLDVAVFEDALARAQDDTADDGLAALREAVTTYAGDLLEGCYDDWVLAPREQLRLRYLEALERLATLLGERSDYAQASGFAERLIQTDPLNEEAYRLLMRLHAASGQLARALQTYHLCSATLERELGVEPSPVTRAVYEALLPAERGHAAPVESLQAIPTGGSALVGRASEWTLLTTLWRETRRGQAQFVLLSGEPGVGKTRLAEELRSWCARTGAVTAEARSYASEGAMALGPLVTWLRSPAITARLGRLDHTHRTALAPLLPDLIPSPSPAIVPETGPDAEQRRRLFEAATQAIHAAGGPLLLIADDLQWCDPETLQFLHYLIRIEPHFPLLMAATARREEIDPQHPVNALIAGLHALERFTEIEVGRLTRDETVMLAEQLAAHQIEEVAAERLFHETEGNPLFVVEALRAGWSSQGEREQISPKVQAVIEDRLAQLSELARDLVGLAATIGREFTPAVLADASDAGEEALVRALDELWRRRIVRERGADAYDFSHDKIREVAYLALSPARRRRHHGSIARALAHRHAADLDAVSSQIAVHWERAGQLDQAIDWYTRAAEAAQRVHASAEVARVLNRALDLLRSLPETHERGHREMAILAAMPAVLGMAEGFASPRLADVHRRALELASTLGIELPPPLLRSLAITSLTESNFARAQWFGQQLHARGEHNADDVLLVESNYVLGIAAFWQGQLAVARGRFAAAVERYRPEYRRAHLFHYGLDPKAICLSRLGNTLWFLGYPEAAVRARDAALALAEEIAHPFTKATVLVFASMLALDLRDPERVHEYAATLIAGLGERAGLPARIHAEALAGYSDVVDGRTAAGIARIQQVLAETHGADHAPGHRASWMRVLLEACAVAGDAQTGLAAAEGAIGLDVTLWEAEARRLRAEFLVALDAPQDEIEAELERALQTARRQGARALELRAATSLLRQRQRRGDGPAVCAARAALQTILDELPQGRDTQDVREAKSLLY